MSASDGWAVAGADTGGTDEDDVVVAEVATLVLVVVEIDGEDVKSSPSFKARIARYAAGYADAGIRAEGIAGVTGCTGSETTASPETEKLTDWPLMDRSLSYCSRAMLSALLRERSHARGYWGYLAT